MHSATTRAAGPIWPGPTTRSTCGARLKMLGLILLGHAAEHADDLVGSPVLDVFQPAQGAVDLVLGVLADAARVEAGCVGPARLSASS